MCGGDAWRDRIDFAWAPGDMASTGQGAGRPALPPLQPGAGADWPISV